MSDFWILIKYVLTILCAIFIVYAIGRILAKGFMDGVDNYITNKFHKLITKKSKNGTEEKK